MDPMGYTMMNVEQETTEKQIKHHFFLVGENCSGLFLVILGLWILITFDQLFCIAVWWIEEAMDLIASR